MIRNVGRKEWKDRWKWLQTRTQPLLPKVKVLWLGYKKNEDMMFNG